MIALARTPEQDAYMTATLARMKAEILADKEAGVFGSHPIASFADLHDHVDANCYGGLCDDSGPDEGPAGDRDCTLRGLDLVAHLFSDQDGPPSGGALITQAAMDACSELQGACDDWIRAEKAVFLAA